jgi:ABC-2 type transport system permease protein
MARAAWVRSHVALSVGGTLVVTAASGFGLGVAYAVVSGEPAAIGRLSAASVATTPAILVLVGVTTAIFGWLPRWSMVAWAAFVVVVGVGVFGEVLGLSNWLRAVSPFDHLAAMPAQDFDPVSTAVLLSIAAGLLALGELGFVRRDLEAA